MHFAKSNLIPKTDFPERSSRKIRYVENANQEFPTRPYVTSGPGRYESFDSSMVKRTHCRFTWYVFHTKHEKRTEKSKRHVVAAHPTWIWRNRTTKDTSKIVTVSGVMTGCGFCVFLNYDSP